jgi:hypothetical protein
MKKVIVATTNSTGMVCNKRAAMKRNMIREAEV